MDINEMRELIQETAGFEKVSYQMAQRWHGEYILNQHKYAKIQPEESLPVGAQSLIRD